VAQALQRSVCAALNRCIGVGLDVLRITRSESEDAVSFILEGKLRTAWLPELNSALATTSAGKRVILDLADLSFVDPSGARLLAALERSGVALRAPSALVAALIDAATT
jgi:anti-anti-sigma regulatory factor